MEKLGKNTCKLKGKPFWQHSGTTNQNADINTYDDLDDAILPLIQNKRVYYYITNEHFKLYLAAGSHQFGNSLNTPLQRLPRILAYCKRVT